MYKLTKASAVKARAQAINQLKAVLITAALRDEPKLGNAELLRTCARFADVSGPEEARREIVRRLKRYAAREVFHLVGQLQAGPRS
ncbi:hypothetical protein ACWY4P_43475 [Streptomyces sp. LZ34]